MKFLPSLATGIMITTASFSTTGFSTTAKQVDKQVKEGADSLLDTFIFGQDKLSAFKELQRVCESCETDNWDGYGGLPINNDAYRQAYFFIESFPMALEMPSVTPESDGRIAFEWYRSPEQLLTVSIGDDSSLHYAALFGNNKNYGTETFSGFIPKQILNLINRVCECNFGSNNYVNIG